MNVPRPLNESQRQAALDAFGILDTAPEESFNDIVLIASTICGCPMGAVTLIDRDRQWLKARAGMGDATESMETSRNDAFCAYTILDPNSVMVVEDAQQDARFQDNPFVRDAPLLRFYAGAPLVTVDGYALGSLCVMGQEPGQMTEQQVRALQALARQVVNLLELRRTGSELENMVREQAWYEERLQQENAQLVQMNRLDPLTGLGNRRALQDAMDTLARGKDHAWVALIDIDHFKVINDTYGHPKGDEVLVAIAQQLRQHAGEGDSVIRLGGEEFVWLMPGVDEHQACENAQRLRRAVEAMHLLPACTVSCGLACLVSSTLPEDALLRADEALYRAKRGGRNRIETHHQEPL